ncbi:MAG: Trk system potassium transporter TrkA [Rhodothermales bacterium]|nr:Trk system potassium transporter TrkA [Rhodothermales bacterium]
MKAVIIGMGEVGKFVARVLAEEKHDVTIVDFDAGSLSRAEEAMDVLAYHGNGASMAALREARVDGADLVAAVTDRDEVNMLAALAAKHLGAKQTIARVNNREYLDGEERGYYHNLLGIDLIVSVQILVANEIYKLIQSVGAVAVENFADNRVEAVQIRVEEGVKAAGTPLQDLALPSDTLVAAVLRQGEVLIPGGGDAVLEGDDLFLIGTRAQIPKLEELFGKTRERSARKVVIVGGGDIGLAVARLLENEPIDVTLIDEDAARCDLLAQRLHQTIILHGDGTDLALLREEGVDRADVFVAASGDDEVNLMSSLLAKNLGAGKTITLVNRPDYVPTYELLGLDATVSPRLFAASQILKYARQGEVVSVSLLEDGKAEILEIVPQEGSTVVDKRLMDLNFPRGAVVAAIATEDGVVIPGGEDVIRAGNNVVVFTLPAVRADVERLFRRKRFSLGGLLSDE